MLIVTLAGGIGSGKSTVAAALAECGARLLSLDDVARDVLSPGEEAVREVGDLWPEAVREGKIDRAALARIVFDDAAALARLNAVVHPRAWERAQAQLASWREESLQAQSAREFVVVVELALLAGSPYQDAYPGTIVVDAPEDVRVLRLVDSRGMDEADARARIASQTPASRVRELADVVVDNGGSLEDAARAARELWEGWLVPYAANMREGRRVFGGDAPPSPGQRARAAARLTRQGAFVNRESALGKGGAAPSRKGAEAALGGGGGETAGDKGGGVLEIVGPADESSLANAGFVPCAGELRAASQTYKSRRVSPDARRDASGDSGDVASGSGRCALGDSGRVFSETAACAPGGPRLYVSADPRFAMAAVVTGGHD
ncbi:hypothetical protein A4H34_07480 [Peptidiphaga gingivicola]|uniref:Dephospho-CoA kinase n=1 Tax=Peptidiphaga gingivicola TaxID=2741497 RepID=A0A179B5K1_9ACTO|nr:dephospho-CoA kinase [Peptidiphaga gingivicola]OAP86937.1 hypothetical protein A4H34_07480 [Peptidiphaga gingivicola]